MLASFDLNGWDDQCGTMAGWTILVCLGFCLFFRLAHAGHDFDSKVKRRTGYGLVLVAFVWSMYSYLGPGWGC